MTDVDEAVNERRRRSVAGSGLWRTCQHESVGPRDHSCPDCGGTMRRCCDSLVGTYEHREGCRSSAERPAE